LALCGPILAATIKFVGDLPSLERIEQRLDQYHGETRELIEAMLVVVRDNALAMREFARDSRDMRAQLHANTQAVLRLLDRLDEGGAPAA
jgi:hypothetical protein